MTRKNFNTTFTIGMLCLTLVGAFPVQAIPSSNLGFSDSSNPALSTVKQLSLNASSDDFAGDERPGSRTSGGSRGPCLDQVIALVPGTGDIPIEETLCETPSSSLLTRTVDDTPTFWFYVPASSRFNAQVGTVAEFVLLDKNGQAIQTRQIPLSNASGIVSVQLTHALELNQSYQWMFSILLNSRNPSQNPAVDGWVRRIDPNPALSNDLAQATSDVERIAAYAHHGIWQDALTDLAALRQTDPNNTALMTDWHDLLNSVGLGAIADAPFLEP
ncbi:MAG TPA: DUF928 domain-containing protein [Crinalium sp.]